MQPIKTSVASDIPLKQGDQPRVTLDQIVNLCVERDASDIHFGEGARIALRVSGKILFIENVDALTADEAGQMLSQMMTSDDEHKRLERLKEVDFSYTHKSGVNFRVNAFYQRGKLAIVMRMISKHIPTPDELGLPEELVKLMATRQGLVLIAGPAGSGKTTTINSLVSYINDNFVRHILTIESPIEYIFENKRCIFTQREVGKDTLGISSALDSAVRQDANVIMVSEIGNMEVLDKVLELVETGHLVIASISAKNSTQAIQKMIDFYPPQQQKQATARLSENVSAVLAQDLTQRIDRPGLVAVYEFMFSTDVIRNLIKRGQIPQLRNAIQSSPQDGMMTMDAYAFRLAERGVIDHSTIQTYEAQNEDL